MVHNSASIVTKCVRSHVIKTKSRNGGLACKKASFWARRLTQKRFGIFSETSLDDVLQISNVFVNVSKGEVAKTKDLQKAFGKTNVSEIVKEVNKSFLGFRGAYGILQPDPRQG